MEVRFVSDAEFIAELEAELRGDSAGFEIESVEQEENPEVFGFDFGLAVVLIGLASDLFFEEPLVPMLVRLIRRRAPRRIRIDTPLGTATFEPGSDMSEEEIREAVKRLADV